MFLVNRYLTPKVRSFVNGILTYVYATKKGKTFFYSIDMVKNTIRIYALWGLKYG